MALTTRLFLVVADFGHLIRAKPGHDRCPRDRIQGVELIMDVLHGQLGYLVLVAQLDRCSGQEHGRHHQQPCPDDSWAHSRNCILKPAGGPAPWNCAAMKRPSPPERCHVASSRAAAP